MFIHDRSQRQLEVRTCYRINQWLDRTTNTIRLLYCKHSSKHAEKRCKQLTQDLEDPPEDLHRPSIRVTGEGVSRRRHSNLETPLQCTVVELYHPHLPTGWVLPSRDGSRPFNSPKSELIPETACYMYPIMQPGTAVSVSPCLPLYKFTNERYIIHLRDIR